LVPGAPPQLTPPPPSQWAWQQVWWLLLLDDLRQLDHCTLLNNKIKRPKYLCRNNSKNKKIVVKKGVISIPLTHIYMTDRSLSWLGTGISTKSDGVKPHLSEIMRSYKCFQHVSKMPTLTYNWANIVIIKCQPSHIAGRTSLL
jgi:hypothetical protein